MLRPMIQHSPYFYLPASDTDAVLQRSALSIIAVSGVRVGSTSCDRGCLELAIRTLRFEPLHRAGAFVITDVISVLSASRLQLITRLSIGCCCVVSRINLETYFAASAQLESPSSLVKIADKTKAFYYALKYLFFGLYGEVNVHECFNGA